jgi:hypothetical protein
MSWQLQLERGTDSVALSAPESESCRDGVKRAPGTTDGNIGVVSFPMPKPPRITEA